jgi:predicted ABC-type ATPase
MPDLIIIAGPNGAGKSTIFPAIQNAGKIDGAFQPNEIPANNYVNPDNLAKDNHLDKISAGKLAIEEIDKHINNNNNFAIETTLSGKYLLAKVKRAKSKGYRVFLVFISLDSYELSVARVIQRALLGKHYIPVDTIIQRYRKSLSNMFLHFIPLADFWLFVDNSDLIPNPLCWGGNIYGDNRFYATDKAYVEKVNHMISDNEIPFEQKAVSYYDLFSPYVFSKIRELVISETHKRPKGNYVVIQRNGKIGFELM